MSHGLAKTLHCHRACPPHVTPTGYAFATLKQRGTGILFHEFVVSFIFSVSFTAVHCGKHNPSQHHGTPQQRSAEASLNCKQRSDGGTGPAALLT
mmetsp:Transcript_93504/g.157150  ORF Transcript_93504/g.157150 Transcript_93504/m.157150 type:complete len:95 (+) Transcript_93504:212-496(+)